MKQADQFLYPKLSSIYNKILQLAAAILLIIILLLMLISTNNKNSEELSEHFTFIAKQQLQQSIAGLVILLEQEFDDKKQQQIIIQQYLDGLTKINFVKQTHLYDSTGLLIAASTHIEKDELGNEVSHPRAKSISELYGIEANQRNLSKKLTPFIAEVRHSDNQLNKLHGYLRFTIDKKYLTGQLAKKNEEQELQHRLMLLLAGVVGFLLTRGFNRFSRRGYRLDDKRIEQGKQQK